MSMFQAGSAFIDFTADDTQLQQAGQRVQTTMERLQKRMQAVSRVARNMLLVGSAAVAGFIRLQATQEKAEARLEAVLRATGHAAGFSAQQLKEHASALQQITTYGDEAIISAQAVLATFRRIGGPEFKDATRLMLDLSAAMEMDLSSAARMMGRALDDPIQGLTALRRAGVMMTEQQQQQIRQFVEVGNVAGAQRVILGELENQMGGVAEAIAKTPTGRLIQLKNELGDIGEALGRAFLPNIERAVTYLRTLTPRVEEWANENQKVISTFAYMSAGILGLLFVLPRLVTAATAIVKTVKVLYSLLVMMKGFIAGLAVAVVGFVAVLGRSITMNESWSESAYRVTRSIGLWRSAIQDLGGDMEELGRISNRISRARAQLESAQDPSQQISAMERLISLHRQRVQFLEEARERSIEAGLDIVTDSDVQGAQRRLAEMERALERMVKARQEASMRAMMATEDQEKAEEERQKTLREFELSMLDDMERRTREFETELDERSEVFRQAGIVDQEIMEFRARQLEQFNARMVQEQWARNREIRDAEVTMLDEQDQATAKFRNQLMDRVMNLREANADERMIRDVWEREWAEFNRNIEKERDNAMQAMSVEMMGEGPARSMAEFKRFMDQRLDEIRQHVTDEQALLEWWTSMWQNFNRSQGRELQGLLDRINDFGATNEERQRNRLMRERDMLMEQARQWGLGREAMIRVEQGFQEEMARLSAEQGEGFRSQFVGLQQMGRAIQQSVASVGEQDIDKEQLVHIRRSADLLDNIRSHQQRSNESLGRIEELIENQSNRPHVGTVGP